MQATGPRGDDWPTYGGTYSAWRYSALDQINRGNVQKLAPAWVFQTGDYENGLQATPIVVDGVLYLSTSNSWVFALDGATGRTALGIPLSAFQSRAAVREAESRRRRGTRPRLSRHRRQSPGRARSAHRRRKCGASTVEDSRQCGCNITGAPLVVKDMVIAGVTGGDSAHRGYLTAFDAATGRMRWRFYTIPASRREGQRNLARRKLALRRRRHVDDRLVRPRV